MSEVKLSIGGRDYSVACADGEEAHIARLGETIDAKLQQLGSNLTARDAQNLLFAALLLADELHEQRRAVSDVADMRERLEGADRDARQALIQRDDEIARLRAAQQDAQVEVAAARAEVDTMRKELETLEAGGGEAKPAAPDLFGNPDLAPALERFADLLENCADKLESKATAP